MNRKLTRIYKQLLQAYGPQQWWPADSPFEVMVGAILTQSTAWTNVEKSIGRLKQKKMLSAHALRDLRTDRLAGLIRSAGYFNQKAKKLKFYLNYFIARYGGRAGAMKKQSLEPLRRELLNVHGIGPETADSILLYALEKPVFVVDAYTKRLFSRLGFFKQGAGYADAQGFFMKHLKADVSLFNEYHALIVNHGKKFCKKSRPRCGACVLRRGCGFGSVFNDLQNRGQ